MLERAQVLQWTAAAGRSEEQLDHAKLRCNGNRIRFHWRNRWNWIVFQKQHRFPAVLQRVVQITRCVYLTHLLLTLRVQLNQHAWLRSNYNTLGNSIEVRFRFGELLAEKEISFILCLEFFVCSSSNRNAMIQNYITSFRARKQEIE